MINDTREENVVELKRVLCKLHKFGIRINGNMRSHHAGSPVALRSWIPRSRLTPVPPSVRGSSHSQRELNTPLLSWPFIRLSPANTGSVHLPSATTQYSFHFRKAKDHGRCGRQASRGAGSSEIYRRAGSTECVYQLLISYLRYIDRHLARTTSDLCLSATTSAYPFYH